MKKAKALARRERLSPVPWVVSRLPVVPATAFGAADEESDHPEDQPDDEQDPEDVKRWCQQATSAEKQQQQDQDDQRNHSPVPPFRARSEDQPEYRPPKNAWPSLAYSGPRSGASDRSG